MLGKTFVLKTGTMAVSSQNEERSIVLIPAGAQIVLLGGDIERETFLKIRFKSKVFFVLTEDLRREIGPVSGISAI